jgi:hypothetical protein
MCGEVFVDVKIFKFANNASVVNYAATNITFRLKLKRVC